MVRFRLYVPADFDELYAIEETCFEPVFRFGRSTMRQLVGRADAAAWIAEEEGRMAGFAVAEWQNNGGKMTAYIVTLEVLSAWRGQGIGGELLRRMEESAQAAGATAIGLHVDAENAGAIHLYEVNGYLAAGREEDFYPEGRAALIYEKLFEKKKQVLRLR